MQPSRATVFVLRNLGGGQVFPIRVRTPQQDLAFTVIRSHDITDDQPAPWSQLAQFFGEIIADGFLAIAIASDFVKGAVAEGGVNGLRLEYPIEEIAMEKMDIRASKFASALAFQEPAGKFR